jgi:hypothetical protein
MGDEPIIREPDQSAWDSGMASLFVPGLGQLTQRRYGTALLQFCSVCAYVIVALRAGHFWSIGVLFNLWSVIDAVWWARASGAEAAPDARESAATSSD